MTVSLAKVACGKTGWLGCGLAGAMLLLGAAAAAQKYTPPPPPLTSAPCKPTKKDPCTQPAPPPSTPEQFPFPGEPGDAKPVDPNAQGVTPAAAAEAHPFPGEPAAAPAAPAKPAESSSSSSSVDPDAADTPDETSPDGKPALKDQGSSGSTRFMRRHLPKVEDKGQREEQDVDVAKYYASTGDFRASYLRAKDAVGIKADDPEAHFLLAAAAQKLDKRDEAVTEYVQYLKLDPEGDHRKVAQKALADLAPR